MQKKTIVMAIAAALPVVLVSPGAWAADTIAAALAGGKTSANVQYRYEDVSTSSPTLPNKGTAYTVRLRLGYTTDTYNGVGAMVETESVKSLNRKQEKGYDSVTNRNTTRERVMDPEITEINQAYLSYTGLADNTAKWGRQRIILDNARFIGNVGWRQNEQTYDALTLVNKSLPDTTVTLGRISNVNRVLGDEAGNSGALAGNHKMKSGILNANYKGFGFGELSGYHYRLNYDALSGVTGNSSNTTGLRLNGSTAMANNKLLYTAEFASQKNAGTNTVRYSAKYQLLEGGVDVTDVAVFKVGFETLGSDDAAVNLTNGNRTSKGFSTPLATLHAFNGWADQFLTTPNNGLKDTYFSVGGKAAGVNLAGIYHTYKADKVPAGVSTNIGKELNLLAAYPIDKNYAVGLKYAKYTDDAASAIQTTKDVKKTWLWGEFKF